MEVWEILEEDFSQKSSKLTFDYMIDNLKHIEGKKFDINYKLQTIMEPYMRWQCKTANDLSFLIFNLMIKKEAMRRVFEVSDEYWEMEIINFSTIVVWVSDWQSRIFAQAFFWTSGFLAPALGAVSTAFPARLLFGLSRPFSIPFLR